MAGRRVARKGATKRKGASRAPAIGESLISDIIAGIRTDVGDEYAQLLGSELNLLKIRGVISTGVPGIDAAIGRGGFPLGRLSILHGGEGSGKTTIALQLCAMCQKSGGAAVYIDKEYKLDPDYARALGVNIDELGLSQPDTLEQVVETIKSTAGTVKKHRIAGREVPTIIIVDSLNASQALETIKSETGKRQFPNEARIWSKELPEAVKLCSKESICLIFISQIRRKINVLYGDDTTTAGGEAPKFHASVIAFLKQIKKGVKEGDNNKKVASLVEVEFKKNQIAPPFGKAQFLLRFGKGVDYYDSLLRVAIEQGWVKHSGKKFTFEKTTFATQGRSQAIRVIRGTKRLRVVLKKRTKGLWNGEEESTQDESEPTVSDKPVSSKKTVRKSRAKRDVVSLD